MIAYFAVVEDALVRVYPTALNNFFRKPAELVQFIKERTPLEAARKRPELEYVFSYLAGIHVRYGSVLEAPWADRYAAGKLDALADAVKEAVDALSIEPDIIARNPGISPFALDDSTGKQRIAMDSSCQRGDQFVVVERQ